MSKMYRDPSTGAFYPFPTSCDESLALGLSRFVDLAGCTSCPEPGPKVRYTDDGRTCLGCLLRSVGLTVELFRQGMPGMPEPFPLSPQEAVEAGVSYFYGGDPQFGLVCQGGPHIRRTDIASRRCLACRDAVARARARGLALPSGDGRRSQSSAWAGIHADAVVTKADALARGLTRYRTGEPCSRGHTGWRFVANGGCCECRKGRES